MTQQVKDTKVKLKKIGRTKVKNSILDGDIIFDGYREYNGYCECDIIFTGKIYEGRGNYLPGTWLITEKITPEYFSFNKVSRAIRKNASSQVIKIVRELNIDLPVKIKKVKIC